MPIRFSTLLFFLAFTKLDAAPITWDADDIDGLQGLGDTDSSVQVTTLDDELDAGQELLEDLSLREAISLVDSGGVITFAPNLDGGTTHLDANLGELVIDKSLTIDASALTNGITIDGGSNGNNTLNAGETRCIVVDDNNSNRRRAVTLRGLTIQKGVTTEEGANIYNAENLCLIDCRILDGRIQGSGADFGGVFSDDDSRLTLLDTLVSGNSNGAVGFRSETINSSTPLLRIEGSEISNNPGLGIDIRTTPGESFGGPISITQSLISDNNGRGISSFGCELTVHACTISNNSATGTNQDGGGIRFFSTAGNIENGLRRMTVSQSTIIGNTATRNGGGIFQVGPNVSSLTSLITGCTILRNTADEGGGVGNAEIGAGSRLQIKNSIIAENSAPNRQDVSGNPTAAGVNFIGNPSSGSGFRNGTDLSFANTSSTISTLVATASGQPLLTDNGGPTPTVQLIDGSPAFNAGSDNTFFTDQRGAPRRSSAEVDIGAVEFTNVRFVTTLADELDDISKDETGLSLREAVRDIGGEREAEIFFDPSLNGGTIQLDANLGTIRIDKAVAIVAGNLPNGITIDGGSDGDDIVEPGEVRCFAVTDADFSGTLNVRFTNLTIQNGVTASVSGGANIVNREDLQLINCRILNGRYLGEDNGGGINSSNGKLTLIDCFVSGNRTTGTSAHGGGIFVEDECEITRSTISGNSVTGPDSNGGGLAIPENRPQNNLVMVRSTIENNRTSQGQGGGVFVTAGTVTYEHCTIVENTGGGIFSEDAGSNTLTATVVRDHSGGDIQGSVGSTYQSSGNNIVGTGNRVNAFSASEISTAPLFIDALGDFGGLVPTRLPLAGSVVINRAVGSNNTTDQTGFTTIGIPDIGAVEFRGVLVTTLVDELNNDTNVSLREAFRDVTPDFNQIFFDPALAGGTIRLDATRGPLVIDKAIILDVTDLDGGITIDGGSNGNLIQNSNETRCLNVTDGDNDSLFSVILRGLTIQNGVSSGTSKIVNAEALTLENCQILNGRLGSGIGSASTGSLTLRDCLISGHQTTGTSSGRAGAALRASRSTVIVERCTMIQNAGEADGGAISVRNDVELFISDSTISENTGRKGGAIQLSDSSATISNSTFSNNRSQGDFAAGGAIFSDGRSRFDHILTLSRCTLVGNSSTGNSGAINAGQSAVDISHCTIVENTAPEGQLGGIRMDSGSRLTISFSILRDNTGGDIGKRFSGIINSQEGNLVGTGDGISEFGVDERNTDSILLSPLANYGGLTETRPPLSESPAVNAALNSTSTADQRGFPIIGTPDIGAAELQGGRAGPFSDLDQDGLPLILERALGTDPNVADFENPRRPAISQDTNGNITFTFGRGSEPLPVTVLILERSTTLQEDSFEEVFRFRFDTGTSTLGTGILEDVQATDFTITDTQAEPRAFYRLGAMIIN